MTQDERTLRQEPGGDGWKPWAGFAALALIASIPYYRALGNSFCNDDWVILHYFRDASLGGIFSPHTLWFYRPLQSLLFAAAYRAAGLNPVPYNLVSLALYFLCAGLWFHLVRRLFRSEALALLAAGFFLANWEFCDILFWKANYGTQLGWLGALMALHAFLLFIRTARRRDLLLALAGGLFALLSKETSVNLPGLAALLIAVDSPEPRKLLSRSGIVGAARKLWPLIALVALYLVFHVACVRDVEAVSLKGYSFSSPLDVAKHFLFALNFLLFFFGSSPLLAGLNPALGWIEINLLFLPFALLAAAIALRDRAALFGLAFAALSLIPQTFLADFHASRFYLIPAAGMGLTWAALVVRAARWLGARPHGPAARLAGAAGAICLALMALRSEAQLDLLVQRDKVNVAVMERFYDYLAAHRAEIPPDVCLVFNGLDDEVTEGLGLREMAKILLGSERAEAFKNGTHLSNDAFARSLDANPNKLLIWLDKEGVVQTKPLGNAALTRTGPLSQAGQ